jgi:hypothetical protein
MVLDFVVPIDKFIMIVECKRLVQLAFCKFNQYGGSSNRIDTIPNLTFADGSGRWQTTTNVAIVLILQLSDTTHR